MRYMIYTKDTHKKIQKIVHEKVFESHYKKDKRNRDDSYIYESDCICGLDIEVSSGWISASGEVVPYMRGKPDDTWNAMQPVSLPYIWQVTVGGEVFIGRDFFDFKNFCRCFPKNVHVIIFIHNLAYEFQFLSSLFRWEKVFARTKRKVIYAVPSMFKNVEFRCSYFLTRLSLSKWGETLGFPKGKEFDYTVLRTPATELSEEELFYCVRDVEILHYGILDHLKQYKHIKKIPLTQTGKVRREVKKRVQKDKNLYYSLIKLLPADATMYLNMLQTFAGGYVHANFRFAGKVIKVHGTQWDFASSYPYCMVAEMYPMTPFIPEVFEIEKVDRYAYLMLIRLKGVTPKMYNHYIGFSKTEKCTGYKLDNGRVIECEMLEMWVTEQDYLTIIETYKIKKIEILQCYRSRKMYLPKIYVEYILELYGQKTSLKDVSSDELPGAEDLYAKSKEFLNSLFGMMVTRIIENLISYDSASHEWREDIRTFDEINQALAELREKNKGRTFNAMQWGVWVTAYGRRHLWECLETVDDNSLYCDTDSIKLIGDADFSWYNEKCDEKLRKVCEFYNLDFSLTRPKTKKGEEKPLGHFVKEDDFAEFCTLGAKKYCYRSAADGALHMTVSGINKGAVEMLENNLENFKAGFLFDKDSIREGKVIGKNGACVRKMLLHYCDAQEKGIVWKAGEPDEWINNMTTGIAMRPTSYKLGVTDDYAEFIGLDCDEIVEMFYQVNEHLNIK